MKRRCAVFAMALLLGLAACRISDAPRLEFQVSVRVSAEERIYDVWMDYLGGRLWPDGQVALKDPDGSGAFPGGEALWRLFPRREVLEEYPGYGWAGVILSVVCK